MTIEILTKAIQQKSVISFEYNKPGKITGIRTGNPHAIFIMRTDDGIESTKVHIPPLVLYWIVTFGVVASVFGKAVAVQSID